MGLSPEGRFKKRLTDKMHNGLKCYEIVDGEITGMAITTTPAHSEMAAIISDEDRTFGGPVLIPDRMIYRINPITGEEHYIFFTKEVIKKINSKYWTEEQLWTLVLMHSNCKTIKEIALTLNKYEEDIIDKIEERGQSFKDMVLIVMLQNNRTDQEIEKQVGISASEIPDRIIKMGGKIEKIPSNNQDD